MGILRKALVGVGLVVGAVVLLYVAGILQAPSAGIEDVGDWGNVSESETEVLTTVWVNNPNPVGVSLGSGLSASYRIDLNGVRMAEGEQTGLDLRPGNNTMTLHTTIRNENIPSWWVAYVRANETIDVTASGQVTADTGLSATAPVPGVNRTLLADATPVIDVLSATANQTSGTYTVTTGDVTDPGLLPGDRTTLTAGYRIERGWVTWGSVNDSTTTAAFHFVVSNPGDVPVPSDPDGFRLDLDMNDVDMFTAEDDALTTSTAVPDTLAPGERHVVDYTVTMDNEEIDDWFRSHVRRGERTDVEATLQLVFRPETLSGVEIAVPPEGATAVTCDMQTAILVDDQETSTTCTGPTGITEADLLAESGGADSGGEADGDDGGDGQSTATITDEPSTATASPTDAVELSPVISATPERGEAPLDVQFDASESSIAGTEIAEYVWRFRDGTPPESGERVQHTFRTAGSYQVELTVVGENGATASTTVTIDVESRF